MYVKARGNFLKLVLHKCYLNTSNLFNQVCYLALLLGAVGYESTFCNSLCLLIQQ